MYINGKNTDTDIIMDLAELKNERLTPNMISLKELLCKVSITQNIQNKFEFMYADEILFTYDYYSTRKSFTTHFPFIRDFFLMNNIEHKFLRNIIDCKINGIG